MTLSTLLIPLVSALALGAEPEGEQARPDLLELSLEELSEVEVTVTSVSRSREPLSDAAAAVTVLTSEDIRRSGALSVPDLLRRVPGMHVGQVSASSWAVASRGFSSVQSNKLLVLSDTRSIYTPLFSGVFWDVQAPFLEDVERVEVIRGPGATLWGANAMNGVVNVTTKSAKDTQGLFASALAGTEERARGALRYGGQVGERFHYRVFGQYLLRDEGFLPVGVADDDRWLATGGVRAEGTLSASDTLTLQGAAYRGETGQVRPAVVIIGRPGPTPPLVVDVRGGHLLARWNHRFSDASDLQLRAYYDRTHRNDPSFLDDLHTWDLDLQHRLPLPWRQELTWGGNVRLTENHNRGKGIFALEPPDSTDVLYSGFLQDRIDLLDTLHVTVGTKLEHNDFSGFEAQPQARVSWRPLKTHTLWGAVSRAVRVPTRLERDVAVDVADPSTPVLPRLLGNPDFGAEELLAYELGYRWQVRPSLSVDVAGFYNVYRALASVELGDPVVNPDTGQVVLPLQNQNLSRGVAKGGEVEVQWRPVPKWRLVASYSNVVLDVATPGDDIARGERFEGATPRHQLRLQSSVDLPGDFELDGFVHSVSALTRSPDDNVPGTVLPSHYVTLDLRLAWRGFDPFELAVVGQNLIEAHHLEFHGGTEVQRGVYAMFALR